MSSPPIDNRYPAFESPENKDGAPLYHSTDGFIPLGFSTPQHRSSTQKDHSNRKYYSAQPKYMLPREKGHRNRGRFQQHSQGGTGPLEKSSPGSEDSRSFGSHQEQHHRHANNRNWKQHGYQQRHRQHQHQQKRNRFGFGHQGNDNSNDDVRDYFHPSMLEDPWAHLEQKSQHEPADCDSSDAADREGDAAASDVGEE
ncbi:M-phase-specific PLK1-interacting protein-like [Sabethes cyaneus]|uniref:M-phase-specific PLK1-interacting protein-like n=1 Tax=Sabethes cyaneus TaxID=53552 RepID=UPI00237ED978|nr:M-phase-specific PLK1-interacting protein-like [Sabethes cyaneus]